ncbi:MAG TPA: hypothetical protein VHY08_13940 [Bacillota bacterium]|nr:hypothetical protein [Bacillota bacterium]
MVKKLTDIPAIRLMMDRKTVISQLLNTARIWGKKIGVLINVVRLQNNNPHQMAGF